MPFFKRTRMFYTNSFKNKLFLNSASVYSKYEKKKFHICTMRSHERKLSPQEVTVFKK